MVSVFPEYLCVPFDEFANGATLPSSHPWAIRMTALATAANATRKPLILETVLTRDIIVAKAVNNNGMLQIAGGAWILRQARIRT